jgi:hypothetical protein
MQSINLQNSSLLLLSDGRIPIQDPEYLFSLHCRKMAQVDELFIGLLRQLLLRPFQRLQQLLLRGTPSLQVCDGRRRSSPLRRMAVAGSLHWRHDVTVA